MSDSVVKVNVSSQIKDILPETTQIISSGLIVHPKVKQINLQGSRGLKGNPRHYSDIDLTLIIDDTGLTPGTLEHEALIQDVLSTTANAWTGNVELDLVACFDTRGCGLVCFNHQEYSPDICPNNAWSGCCGLYKIRRGFLGYIPPIGVHMERIYPSLVLYKKDE